MAKVSDAESLLAGEYGFDAAWLAGRLKPMLFGSVRGVALLTERKQPFLILAIGSGRSAQHGLEAAVKAALEKDQHIELGGWTDGTPAGTKFIALRRRTKTFDQIAGPASVVNYGQAHGVGKFGIGSSRDKSVTPLRPVDESFGRILFEAHSALRDVDGLHPDEALDELCKLIYAKLYDEERADEGSGTLRFQLYPHLSADETASAVRQLYSEACEYDTRVFSLKIPGYQRSRGVFAEPLLVSGAAIHQIVRTFQPLSFLQADVDVKGRAFQKVLGPTFRGALGQYFTPPAVIKFLVEAVNPTVDDLVLDPFCGSGHILATVLEHVRKNTKGVRRKLLAEFAFGKLHGIEISSRMVRVAMTDMRLLGDGHSNIRCADALLAFSAYGDLAPGTIDVVLTNPPFGSLLGREALARLGEFSLATGNSTPLELLGLERTIQFLRPGGRFGIVLPEGILTNRKADFVRAWLATQVKIRGIVGLPTTTFSVLGASIKTCILIGRKWNVGEDRGEPASVWMAEIENIGFDATGKPSKANDMPNATASFRAFIEKEGW